MINISGLPLIFYSSMLLLPVVLKLAISLTLDFTLPLGLLSFCSLLPKFCHTPFCSYTFPFFHYPQAILGNLFFNNTHPREEGGLS